jgi:bacterioferritin
MKGTTEVIDFLNELLTHELTAINQYFIHSRMCSNWGYHHLAEKKRHESIEEMKHADKVIERILFLEGVPNMQRLNPVRVGENVLEQHQADRTLELHAVALLNRGIALARGKDDNGTRALLESTLREEEESLDWLETQLHLIEEVGLQQYLSEQIRG